MAGLNGWGGNRISGLASGDLIRIGGGIKPFQRGSLVPNGRGMIGGPVMRPEEKEASGEEGISKSCAREKAEKQRKGTIIGCLGYREKKKEKKKNILDSSGKCLRKCEREPPRGCGRGNAGD